MRIIPLACLFATACTGDCGGFTPPEPDRCEAGETAASATLEIGGVVDPFEAWSDNDVVDFDTGGQGLDMLPVRFRLSGGALPACVTQRTEVTFCPREPDCAEPTIAFDETPIATYAEGTGDARVTKPLWLIVYGRTPANGEPFEIEATVAGVTRTLRLQAEQARVDAGPPADARPPGTEGGACVCPGGEEFCSGVCNAGLWCLSGSCARNCLDANDRSCSDGFTCRERSYGWFCLP